MPGAAVPARIWIYLLRFRIFLSVGGWWRSTETIAQVVVDPVWVHFNFAFFLFGGNNNNIN